MSIVSRLFLFILLVPTYSGAAYYVKDSFNVIDPSYNSIGQTGLIQLPSALLQKSGTVGVTIGNGSLNKFISVIATPFPWLEASFFYHRPRDTFYIKQHMYLDKGFNVKMGFNYKGINFAVGLDDIAGTGFFTKEYLVATSNLENFAFTLGIGTGAFAGDHFYTNPISSFRKRPQTLFGGSNPTGGELDFNTFFKGPVGIFGGIEFFSSRFPGLAVKIESNPYNYQNFLAGGKPTEKSIARRKKREDFNISIDYKFKKHYSISLAEINGNSFNLTFNAKLNFYKSEKRINPKKVNLISDAKDKKLAFYTNILRNLEKDNLFLQSAELSNKNNLHLGVVNNKYNNPVSVFEHIKMVTSELANLQNIELSNLTVSNINSGIETGKITGRANNALNPKELGYIEVEEAENNTNDLKFQTRLIFPEYYNKIKPHFVYRYADPTRFLAGGIDIQFSSEIKFSPDLYIASIASYQVFNTFDRSRYLPDSPYLPHVRTDRVKYLQERSDLYLNSLEINKLKKLFNGHYIKLSAGMYEMMYGGYGIEYLWKPFSSNLSFGLNIYQVKQRDFKQELKFRDYETVTGHSNFIYFHPSSGLTLDLSVGKYLAGDKGYTLDFSRRFKSGFKMGAYFTRTNVSKRDFGEGSFDKGFYFEIPFNIFDSNSDKGSNKFLIQPLTRDGGAKLQTNNPLIYFFMSASANDYNYFSE